MQTFREFKNERDQQISDVGNALNKLAFQYGKSPEDIVVMGSDEIKQLLGINDSRFAAMIKNGARAILSNSSIGGEPMGVHGADA